MSDDVFSLGNYGVSVGAMVEPAHQVSVHFSLSGPCAAPTGIHARISTIVTCDFCVQECNYLLRRLSPTFDVDTVRPFVKWPEQDGNRGREARFIAAVVEPFLREHGVTATAWEYVSYSSNPWVSSRAPIEGWYARRITCPDCPRRHSCGM